MPNKYGNWKQRNPALPRYAASAAELAVFNTPGLLLWHEFNQTTLAGCPGLYSQDKTGVIDRMSEIVNAVTGAPATTTLDGNPAITFAGAQSIKLSDPLEGLGQTSFVAGSGGANGTFALPFPSPADSSDTQAAGTFTVSGGAVVSVAITNPGTGYSSTVTFSNAQLISAGATGISGASVTVAQSGGFSLGDWSFAVRCKPSSFPGGVSSTLLGSANPLFRTIHLTATNGFIAVFANGAQQYLGAVANTAGVSLQLIVGYTQSTGRLTVVKNGSVEFTGTGKAANTDPTAVIGDATSSGLAGDHKFRGDIGKVLHFNSDITQVSSSLANVVAYV